MSGDHSDIMDYIDDNELCGEPLSDNCDNSSSEDSRTEESSVSGLAVHSNFSSQAIAMNVRSAQPDCR